MDRGDKPMHPPETPLIYNSSVNRSDQLAARLFRLSKREGVVPAEAFLEEALAAALEEPTVWPQLRMLGRWNDTPEHPPTRVDTQVQVDDGRTDIMLYWSDGSRMTLELKAWSPPAPTLEQMLRYGKGGTRVAAVCTNLVTYPPPILPTVTWTRIRQHRWPQAPLVWRQLCHLLDALGVAVPLLDVQQMVSIPVFTRARQTVARYAAEAGDAVAKILDAPTVHWSSDKYLHEGHGRMAVWTWPGQWDTKEKLGIACGLFTGRDGDPLLVSGVPDFLFLVHANPKMPRPLRLHDVAARQTVMDSWCSLPGQVHRSVRAGDWELLRARESLAFLLTESDQEAAFVGWMEQRARELVDIGGLDWLLEVERR